MKINKAKGAVLLTSLILIIIVTLFQLLNVSNMITLNMFETIILLLLLTIVLVIIPSRKLKRILKEVVEWIYLIIFTISIYLIFTNYILFISKVSGDSMLPTLSNNQILAVNVFNYNVKNHDIVVYKESATNQYLVKRVAGVTGDTLTIDNGYLKVNGDYYTNVNNEKYLVTSNQTLFKLIDGSSYILKKDELILLGDNSSNSRDSRSIGIILKRDIMGKVL